MKGVIKSIRKKLGGTKIKDEKKDGDSSEKRIEQPELKEPKRAAENLKPVAKAMPPSTTTALPSASAPATTNIRREEKTDAKPSEPDALLNGKASVHISALDGLPVLCKFGFCAQVALQRRLSKSDLLKTIPSFSETPATGRQALLIQKLRLCCILFDWDDDLPKDLKAKEQKKRELQDIISYISSTKGAISSEAAIVELMQMIRTNLFRPLPPKQHDPTPGREPIHQTPSPNGAGEGDEEDPVQDPAWMHLQSIYDLLLRLLVSTEIDMKSLKRHITGAFVSKLLDLFDSEDKDEREYLKTILHRIYSKFMSLRAFIRKAINNVFYTCMYDTENPNGIAELLEILGSIINGFAQPLKQEHKQFLRKVLIPMHKVRTLPAFHPQLMYCVTQFVHKDHTLAVPVILGLLKYWPLTNSTKEVLFLTELEEMLDLTQPDEFKAVLVPLFRQLAKCIGSQHFQVAERTLLLLHNEYVSSLIAMHHTDIIPILFSALHTNSEHHWNASVSSFTMSVLKVFMELDSTLVEECMKEYLDAEAQREGVVKNRRERWAKLMASSAHSLPPPTSSEEQKELEEAKTKDVSALPRITVTLVTEMPPVGAAAGPDPLSPVSAPSSDSRLSLPPLRVSPSSSASTAAAQGSVSAPSPLSEVSVPPASPGPDA